MHVISNAWPGHPPPPTTTDPLASSQAPPPPPPGQRAPRARKAPAKRTSVDAAAPPAGPAEEAPKAAAPPAEPAAEPKAETKPKRDAPRWPLPKDGQQLHLVRFPRAERDQLVLDGLQARVESFQNTVNLLRESLRAKKVMLRDAQQEATKELGRLQAARAEVNAKAEEMAPMKDAVDAVDSQNREVREQLRELGIRSEEELDKRLDQLEHTMNHEVITIQEEKKMVMEIKKLTNSRDKIRALLAQQAKLQVEKAGRAEMQDALKDMRSDMRILLEQRDIARDRFQEVAGRRDEVRAEVKKMEEALDELVAEKDAAYRKLADQRGEYRSQDNHFFAGRKTMDKARDKWAGGSYDEARDLCSQQVEDAIAKFVTDKAFRKEYLQKTEKSRAKRERLPEDDIIPAVPAKGGKKAAAAGEPVSPRTRALAIIEQIRMETEHAMAAKAAAETAAAEAREEKKAKAAKEAAENREADDAEDDAPKPAEPLPLVSAMELPKKKKTRAQKAKTEAAEPVAVPDVDAHYADFTIPEEVVKAQAAAEELKMQERMRARQAQAHAAAEREEEERKAEERRAKNKERKQRQKERKQAEEAEKAKREAERVRAEARAEAEKQAERERLARIEREAAAAKAAASEEKKEAQAAMKARKTKAASTSKAANKAASQSKTMVAVWAVLALLIVAVGYLLWSQNRR